MTVARAQVSGVADLRMDMADLPPVICDVAELDQPFLNLVVNAANAIEDTGRRWVISPSGALGVDHPATRATTCGPSRSRP